MTDEERQHRQGALFPPESNANSLMGTNSPAAKKVGTPAAALGLIVSVLVTGAVVLPAVAASFKWVETYRGVDLPRWLAMPAGVVVIGAYMFVARRLAVWLQIRFFD